MGNPFESEPTVVQVPSSQNVQGTGEVKPYAEVEPYLKNYLPTLEQVFTEAPTLYTDALTPGQSEATKLALQGYGDVATGLSGLGAMGQQALQQQGAQSLQAYQAGEAARQAQEKLGQSAYDLSNRYNLAAAQGLMGAGETISQDAISRIAALQGIGQTQRALQQASEGQWLDKVLYSQ